MLYGGSWDKPEYKKLVQNKTDLAITSGKLLPLSGETLTERKQTAPADAESLTAVEYRDRLYDLADRFAVLDIPMLIDRSADEAEASRDDRPDEGVTRIVVAKNRSGPIGDVDLMFLPASTKFYELDGAHAEE